MCPIFETKGEAFFEDFEGFAHELLCFILRSNVRSCVLSSTQISRLCMEKSFAAWMMAKMCPICGAYVEGRSERVA
jgi:hypothetical protein